MAVPETPPTQLFLRNPPIDMKTAVITSEIYRCVDQKLQFGENLGLQILTGSHPLCYLSCMRRHISTELEKVAFHLAIVR